MSAVTIFDAFARTRAIVRHDLLPPDISERYGLPVLDELVQFHQGIAGLDGRFPARYNELCGELASLLRRIDGEFAPRTLLEPVKSLDVGLRTQVGFRARFMPIVGMEYPLGLAAVIDVGLHLMWWQLRECYITLRESGDPVYQTVTVSSLPVELIAYSLDFLDNRSLTRASLACRMFHNVRLRMRNRSFRYIFCAHRPVRPMIEGCSLPPFVGDVYGRLLCDLAGRMSRANSTEYTLSSVRHLSLHDHWAYTRMIVPFGSQRLLSPDFLQLGRAGNWILSRFPALQRASFHFIYLSNDLLSALSATRVSHISLRYCGSLYAAGRDAAPRPPLLLNVRTVDFKLDQLALREKETFWNLLGFMPNLTTLRVSSNGPFHALDLIAPHFIQVPKLTLRNLATIVLVGLDQSSLTALLGVLTDAAPNVKHIYVLRALSARRSMASATVPTGEFLDAIRPWAASIETLNVETLDDKSSASIRATVGTLPALKRLTWPLKPGEVASSIAPDLARFQHLELFRTNCPTLGSASSRWKLLAACSKLGRICMCSPESSIDKARWTAWRCDLGCFMDQMVLDVAPYHNIFSVENPTWASVSCATYD